MPLVPYSFRMNVAEDIVKGSQVTSGVVYLLIGNHMAVDLLVSLFSLRQHYRGPIALLTDSNTTAAHHIAADKRLGIQLKVISPINVPTSIPDINRILITKSAIHQFTPFIRTVFLDADTLIVGAIHALLPLREEEITLTQFSNWCVQPGRSLGTARLREFADATNMVPVWEAQRACRQPLVNTGVLGFFRSHPLLEAAHSLALKGCHCHSPDERAVQFLYPNYPYRLLDDRWNCHSRLGTHRVEAVIWHFGKPTLLPPSPQAYWRILFWEIIDRDIGHPRSWMDRGQRKRYADMAKSWMFSQEEMT